MTGPSIPNELRPYVEKIAEEVASGCEKAFERFAAKHGDEGITGFALCTVDDGCTPYVMGTTIKDQVGIPCVDEDEDCNGWDASPEDWCWDDESNQSSYVGDDAISEVFDLVRQQYDHSSPAIHTVFLGCVEGLKKFDASGKFRGILPRDQMLLLLWISDPGDSSKWVMDWVDELNPPKVGSWFRQVYTYRT